MSIPENLPQVFEDDSIDLIALLKQIYQGRKLILLSAFVAAILGVVVALATPNTYTSGATFIPQTGGDSKPSSSLSGLASLAGINLGGMGGGSDIPPTIYPQIVTSIPYKLDLLDENIEVLGNVISLREYLSNDSNSSILGAIRKYTIGLPSTIFSSLRGTMDYEAIQTQDEIYQINEDDRILFNLINNRLILSSNGNSGVISLEFSDKDKFVAAQVANRAMHLLQERIIAFKNNSARELLDFTTRQYQKNKTSYEALQDSIAIFKDQNLNISSSLYQNRLDRLMRELNIASSVVGQLASQVEQAKLRVNKETPLFIIIEPVSIPYDRSAPKRYLMVIIWVILGVVLSTGFVLFKDAVKQIIVSIKD